MINVKKRLSFMSGLLIFCHFESLSFMSSVSFGLSRFWFCSLPVVLKERYSTSNVKPTSCLVNQQETLAVTLLSHDIFENMT